MFAEEDWNDDGEAQALSNALFHKVESSHCISIPNVQTPGGRKNEKLLQTLRDLSAAGTPGQSPGGGPSHPEHGAAKKTGSKNKRKKKRGKKAGEGAGAVNASPCKPDAARGGSAPGKPQAARPDAGKENQSRAAGGPGIGGAETGGGSTVPPRKVLKAGGPGGTSGQAALSHKQWRNRMKNKRRNKNKFRPSETLPAPSRGAAEWGRRDRTPSKSAAEPDGGGSVADRPEPEIKRRKEEGNEAAERTVSRTSAENTTSRDERAREQSPKCEAVSNCKKARRKGPGWTLIPERSHCIPGLPTKIVCFTEITSHSSKLPGVSARGSRGPSSAVVADFGCGDCKIARSVSNKVHSFDLVALNEHVTVCDMAAVPLPAESVDIVVFCLSLMGTNLLDFLSEANRVLRPGGILKIAEVASRFGDVRNFISALGSLGFKLGSKDTGNSYFYLFDFRKSQSPREKAELRPLELKPCLYKKR
uniref:ribosomal RNA-processing protein 8 n=1 Tax=Pristiophorus japonicus TaxID=55135 RepID=UPI00398E8525